MSVLVRYVLHMQPCHYDIILFLIEQRIFLQEISVALRIFISSFLFLVGPILFGIKHTQDRMKPSFYMEKSCKT